MGFSVAVRELLGRRNRKKRNQRIKERKKNHYQPTIWKEGKRIGMLFFIFFFSYRVGLLFYLNYKIKPTEDSYQPWSNLAKEKPRQKAFRVCVFLWRARFDDPRLIASHRKIESKITNRKTEDKGERTRDLKDTNKSLMVLSPLLSFLFSISSFSFYFVSVFLFVILLPTKSPANARH